MTGVIRANRCWQGWVLCIIAIAALAGCGEGSPVRVGRSGAVVDDINLDLSPRVRIAGTWTSPAKIAEESAAVNTSDMLHGPHLAGDGSGNALVTWRMLVNLDAQTGNFTQGHNSAYRYLPPQPWAASDPSGGATLDNASMYAVAVNRYTGHIHVAWREGDNIKANHVAPGNAWGTAQDLGAGNWVVLANSKDDHTLMVVGAVDTQAQTTTLKAMHFDGGDWVAGAQIMRAAADVHVSNAVLLRGTGNTNMPGTLVTAWTETAADGTLGLWAANYSEGGWGEPFAVGQQRGNVDLLANPQLIADNTNGAAQLIYFAGKSETQGALYIANFDGSRWIPARPFDPAQVSPRKASSDFTVAADDAGNAVVAWREETTINGIDVNGIYARTYSPKGVRGWNVVRRVSGLGRLTPSAVSGSTAHVHAPHVSLNNSAVIALTWIEETPSVSEVLISYADFAGNPLWPLSTELVSMYNLRDGKAEHPQVTINDSNGIVVAWRQSKSSATKIDYTLWSSVKGTQQGQAVDVVLGNAPPPPPPSTGQLPLGHSAFTAGCIDCHNNTRARGQPATHITTSNKCEKCHSTTKWKPPVTVNHTETVGTCVSCHNGKQARGRPMSHIAASDKCEACHAPSGWKPVVKVDHAEVLGSCVTCHVAGNTVAPLGKSATHVVSTDDCTACHTNYLVNGVLSWTTGVMFNHAQATGSCVSCHNGTVAMGKPGTHLPTSDQCDSCHKVTAFIPLKAFDHTQTSAACDVCHGGNMTSISSKPATHVVTSEPCDKCHTTVAWRPAVSTGGNGGGSGTINGTWGEPVNVVTISSPGNTLTLVHGPELAWGANSSGFVSVHKNTGFNFSTGQFGTGEDIVKWLAPAGTSWVTKNPVPTSQAKSADFAQIKAFGDTGGAYALWQNAGDLYFNKFNGTTWGTAEKIGGGAPQQYQLLVASNGMAVALWVSGTEINMRRYIPAAGTTAAAWQDLAKFDSGVTFVLNPVAAIAANGDVYVAWVERGVAAAGSEVYVARANANAAASGLWLDASQTGQFVPPGAQPLSMTLVLHSMQEGMQIPMMLLQTNGAGNARGVGIFDSLWSGTEWTAWQPVDGNAVNVCPTAACTSPVKHEILGEPLAAHNDKGDVIVLWTEKETTAMGVAYHVYSNFLAFGANGWGDPVHVSMSNDASSMSVADESQPSMMIDNDGHVTAVWLVSDGNTSKVVSNHYHKVATGPNGQVGWNLSPELVVSYAMDTDGYAFSPRVGVGSNGKAIVSWKQVIWKQFGVDYKIWSSSVP